MHRYSYVEEKDLKTFVSQYEHSSYRLYSVHLTSKPQKPVLNFTKLKIIEPTVQNIRKAQR